ncbi:melibiose operon regulatory protein [Saccharicrinis fermentans DSM 9555 = JCM 21142]|uniref:Melibiose operon regulatory protein n=1 Tax=Saccharicrinis fermentans DSM 9555 = JCM 21142 TaxID=869213 RepID=W7YFR6_9BACT|nr:melibiose operon regulatory protein [Saccharicrinis fermentans DSM 9555 = JCM 21142]
MSNTGNFYYLRGDYDNAHHYYQKSYEHRKKHYNKPLSIISSLFHLGDLDLVNQNFKSSEANLKKAVFLADSANLIGWAVTASKRLVDIYKKTNDYKKHTKALEQYVSYKDRWNSEVQNTKFNKLTLQYEKKHNEAIIAMQANQLKIGRLLLIIISISLIFVISITVFIFIHKAARLRAFRAIYRQQLLVNDQKRVIESLLKEVNTIKPEKSESVLRSRLVELLEKQEIYKNQDVSLEFVANKLATNITYVSKLVNSEFNCNFNTLINQHRINYCKSCIKDNEEKIPMKSIGLNAGFKSQSTFYATFKEFVGMTPLQYAKISKMEIKQKASSNLV